MRNPPLLQGLLGHTQHGSRVAVLRNDQVHRGECARPVEGPQVQVVNIHHAVHLAEKCVDLGRIVARRGLLQQDSQRMHHELPGTRQHECRDDEGRNDVRVLPPGRHNDATSDEDGDGAQHVRQHVEERPLDVHRVLPLTVQNPCRYRVRDQTDQRNDHHRAS